MAYSLQVLALSKFPSIFYFMFRLAFALACVVYFIVWFGGITLYKILQVLFLVVCFFIAALLGKMMFDNEHKNAW